MNFLESVTFTGHIEGKRDGNTAGHLLDDFKTNTFLILKWVTLFGQHLKFTKLICGGLYYFSTLVVIRNWLRSSSLLFWN